MVEASGESQTFAHYCGAGQTTMDGKGFAKLAKDTKLIDKKLTATDVDLAFSKIKERTARRITFAQFQAGLQLFADKKQCGLDAIVAKVAASRGPILKGTATENVRLHDDTSTYTGVYAQGGPSNVDHDPSNLAGLLDRSDADVRGIKTGQAASVAAVTHAVAGINLSEESKKPVAKKGKKKAGGAAAAATPAAQPAGSMQEVFASFAAGQEMDGKSFMKLCKDCKLLNTKCKSTNIDLIFAKCKERTARKINFQQFCNALNEVAQARQTPVQDVEALVMSHGGPSFAGTQAEAVRFHDDTDQYTGVHAHGGPSTVGGTGGVRDISDLCDRSSANVRGVKK